MRPLILAVAILSLPAFAGGKFSLTSADLKANATMGDKHVFNAMGCTGENLSPALAWTNPPAGTKSFVVTAYDPDAPTGSGWWHWVVYNLPAATTELAQGAGSPKGALPEGTVQGRTDFGAPGYGGACPPEGDKPHKYVFTVYALKIEKIEVPADSTAAMVGYMTHANALGKAELTVKYGRAK